MLIDKWKPKYDETHFECDCGCTCKFTEGYNKYIDKVVCPACGDEFDYEKEDWTVGFDPDGGMDWEPMSEHQYMKMKGVL